MNSHDPLEYVERLARRARQETAPCVDAPLRGLGRRVSRRNPIARPLAACAAFSAALTGVTVAATAYLLTAQTVDPYLTFFQVLDISGL